MLFVFVNRKDNDSEQIVADSIRKAWKQLRDVLRGSIREQKGWELSGGIE